MQSMNWNQTVVFAHEPTNALSVTYMGNNTYNISCTAPGLVQSIDFGDGQSSYIPTTHTYNQNGNYTLTCQTRNDADWAGPSIDWIWKLQISVPPTTQTQGNVTLTIAPNYPQNNSYIFNCNAFGFTPTLYDYTFGDGQSWSNVTFNNSFHTYQNGNV